MHLYRRGSAGKGQGASPEEFLWGGPVFQLWDYHILVGKNRRYRKGFRYKIGNFHSFKGCPQEWADNPLFADKLANFADEIHLHG